MTRTKSYGRFLLYAISLGSAAEYAHASSATTTDDFGDVTAAGDLNGDGLEDSAVGVPGAVYVVLSGEPGNRRVVTLRPDVPSDSFGTVLKLRRSEKTGQQELLVGEPSQGRNWVYRMGAQGWEKPVLENAPKTELVPHSARFSLTLREECTPQADIPWEQMNALEKHVTFFDLNGDQRITLKETYRGLRDLGLNAVLAGPAAVAINGALATPTAGYPTLTIPVENIEGGIHGSDSGIYDDDGHFVPAVFHRWFEQWDGDQDGALNAWELTQRWYKEADLFDFFGVIASGGEFSVLYLVAAEDGKISEARMRGLYDGSLFYAIAADRGTLGCRVPFNSP